jgi:GNAT superfamily N-acetyltransferase
LAEDAWAYTPLWPGQVREERDEYVLWHGATPVQRGSVTRIRLSDSERGIADARAWFRERGREYIEWFVADGSEPADLEERLLAHGATEQDDYAAMIVTTPPPGAERFEARPIRTFEELVRQRELQWEIFDVRTELREAGRQRHEQAWQEYAEMDDWVAFGAFAGNELIAGAGVIFTPLGGFLAGGGTHPDWRRRGAYSALVRARWDEAARRGVPVLAVHAAATSRPILERLGFRTVSHVHVLLDHAG